MASFIKILIYRHNESFHKNTKIIERIIDKGLPEESVLSPLMHAVFTKSADIIQKCSTISSAN